MTLDAHVKPPQNMRDMFKFYQRITPGSLQSDEDVIDFRRGLSRSQQRLFQRVEYFDEESVVRLFTEFLATSLDSPTEANSHLFGSSNSILHAYSYVNIPGLLIIPALLPPKVQEHLLACILNRDLSDPSHRTNVHFHHNIQYPPDRSSFFGCDPSEEAMITPKSPKTHKPLSIEAFLCKKLRWMTLGGQYDWTRKIYSHEESPIFPKDIGRLLKGLFPQTTAEAAIVNLYSPGDVLSLHRDVSEECDKGLISVSMGCDGLFFVGPNEATGGGDSSWSIIRLHSGDVVYMSGQSRYAWHGVPKIIGGTCPDWLMNWPAKNEIHLTQDNREYSHNRWIGWMASKRINLNVRQIRD